MGHMPNAQVCHVGIRNSETAVALGGLQSDAGTHVRQNDGILVKQIVRQWDLPILEQGVGTILAIQEAIVRETDPCGPAGGIKAQAVILEAQALLQRNTEAGVAAHAEIQRLGIPVFHLECDAEGVFFQSVEDPE